MIVSATSRSRDAAPAFERVVSFLHFDGLTTLTLYTVEFVPTPTREFSPGIVDFFWGLFRLIAYVIVTFESKAVSNGAPVLVLWGLLDRHGGCLARLAGGDTGKSCCVGTRQLPLSLHFLVEVIHVRVHT